MARVAWRSDVRRLPAGSAGRNGVEGSGGETVGMYLVRLSGTNRAGTRFLDFVFRVSLFGRYSRARHAFSQVTGAVPKSEQAVTSEACTEPNSRSL